MMAPMLKKNPKPSITNSAPQTPANITNPVNTGMQAHQAQEAALNKSQTGLPTASSYIKQ
jgi:hypothetical protein